MISTLCRQMQAGTALGGGDYFFQLKNENRHAYKAAVQKANGTPLLPAPKNQTPAMNAATSAR